MNPRLPIHGRIKPSCPRRVRAEGGAALIIVLTCLVLVAGLAIALLNRVEADRTSSAAYKGGANSRNLSEYAVNVVMAQITAATTGANAGNGWASQPGAIRVYSATSSNLVGIYKLYSSSSMLAASFPTADTTPTAWASSPALYTDLNAPVYTPSGSTTVTNYPILDPRATNSVQGFAISGAPNATALQPAPMPVSWLYVLQDGTLVAPTGTGSTATVAGASTANPITGRIAFWTDDETCKVNINTAAGAEWNFASNNTGIAPFLAATINTPLLANYWDVPMFATLQDNNLTYSQPWRGEYQRFPGHPSTVSLSAVFTNLTATNIMTIVPRITYTSNGVAVGSQWGTSLSTNTGGTITSDGARLYANVDELLYATNRSSTGTNPLTATNINQARFFLTASSRAPEVTMFNTPRMLMWPINVSTNMRTSYDNLMARAIGQLPAQGTTLAAYQTYYFLRSDPLSSTTDYGLSGNTSLLTYFKNLTETPVPGFGGTGILKKYSVYNTKEPDQIRTEIFDYIRCINLQDHSMTTANTYCYSTDGIVVPTLVPALSTFGYGRFPTVSKVGLLFWYGQTNNPGAIFTHVGATNMSSYTNQSCQIVARLVMETFNPAFGYPAMTNISPASGGGYSNVVTGLTSGGFQWGSNTASMVNLFSSDSATYQEDNATNLATWTQIAGRRPIIMSTNNTTAAFATNSPTFVQTTYRFTNGALIATNSGASNGTTIFTGVVTTSGDNWSYVTNGITNTFPANNAYYSNGIVTNINGTFFFTGGNVNITTYYNGKTIQTINNISLPGANMQLALPTPAVYVDTNNVTNPLPQFNGTNAWLVAARANNSALYLTNDPGAILPTDVVLSSQIVSGDFRMIPRLGATAPAANYFTNHPAYWSATNSATSGIPCNYAQSFVHLWGLYKGSSMLSNGYYSSTPTFYTNTAAVGFSGPSSWPNGDMITNSTNGGAAKLLQYGDFDNGYGSASDGPYIGFCEEGTTSTNMNGSGDIPYFPPTINSKQTNLGIGYFSPNRLVPSAGVMGSLPTGVMAGNPWQTLLFRPAALTSATHPGLANPPDYLLLDLFNMPVVEPYAISEALSTAGRINMNYQILPFTWIKRSTAVQAALHTERVVAVPNTIPSALNRKTYTGNNTPAGNNITNRFPLNLDTNTGTLAGFEARFGSNEIFRSAAEICSIPLVPQGVTVTPATINTVMSNWWTSYTYTGENSKERPYARIYPKLTTKSNVYTVHYTVQVLKKLPSGTQDQWDDTKDKVLSTYRGSTMIERFVNPIDASIKDYRSLTPAQWSQNPLPYKFRIVNQRQFSP